MKFVSTPIAYVLLTILVFGCTARTSTAQQESSDQGSGNADTSYEAESASFYYDFDDILVPREMELDIDESFILETPNVKSGLMVFNGMVEIRSLTDYFINNMAKDGWSLRSAFRSNRTILVFEKTSRYCIINITNERYNTLLEIWVSPSSGGAGF